MFVTKSMLSSTLTHAFLKCIMASTNTLRVIDIGMAVQFQCVSWSEVFQFHLICYFNVIDGAITQIDRKKRRIGRRLPSFVRSNVLLLINNKIVFKSLKERDKN